MSTTWLMPRWRSIVPPRRRGRPGFASAISPKSLTASRPVPYHRPMSNYAERFRAYDRLRTAVGGNARGLVGPRFVGRATKGETMSRLPRTLLLALATLLVLAACSDGGTSQEPSASTPASEPESAEPSVAPSEAAQEEVELSLAHSYQEGQPQVECGANVIRDEVEAADVGITIEIFGASELGGDADRIQSVIAGDIDM